MVTVLIIELRTLDFFALIAIVKHQLLVDKKLKLGTFVHVVLKYRKDLNNALDAMLIASLQESQIPNDLRQSCS